MRYFVYVFELLRDECVKACRAKPCASKSMRSSCLYVGSSHRPISERQRLIGKTSKHVKRALVRSRYDLLPVPSSFETRREAERAERRTAVRLRAQGFTVFQG